MLRNTLRPGVLLSLALLIGGCDSRSVDEKLLEHVGGMDFKVDVVVLEMRGSYFVTDWYPVVLYFGYGGDGNMSGCLDEANRLNKKEGADKFRCAVVAKSKR